MARRTIHDPVIGARIAEKRKQRKWSVRNAAKVAGISNATWSRIERGQQATNNLFVLSDIAAALGCPVGELTGANVTAPRDPKLVVARSSVPAIREALLEADLDEPAAVEPLPLAALEREVALVCDLQLRCDYAGLGQRLPNLIQSLHAAADGPDWEPVLRLIPHAGRAALVMCQHVGYPAEGWLAAEWGRRAAEQLEDPVMTGYAAYVRAAAAIGCGVYRRGHRLAARAADNLMTHLGAEHAPEVFGMLLLQSATTAYGSKQPGDGAEYFAVAESLAGRTGETTTFNMHFGPTNVAFRRVPAEADGGDPAEAARVALATNPSVVEVPHRQGYFHMDTARALTLVGRDKDAERHIVTAERIAPQLVRPSPTAIETARGLRDRVGGSALRGLCERMGMPD